MYRNCLFKVLTLLMGLLVALANHAVFAAPATQQAVDLQFVTHLDAGMPEQDVFIMRDDLAPEQVVRVEGDAGNDPANLAQMAYATATKTEHDPFKVGENPLGPYEKGSALGFTLGEWLAGTGSGSYTLHGNTADLDLAFQNLVPNGVYTLWCSRVTFPPNTQIVDRPCGAADGSQNGFVADAQGNARFHLTLDALPASTEETATLIAAAYHSDGQSYGAYPGDFGLNSHVHVLAMLPAPAPETLPETGAGDGGGLGWLMVIVGTALVMAGWRLRTTRVRA